MTIGWQLRALALWSAAAVLVANGPARADDPRSRLSQVRSWGYQLSNLDIEKLAASPYDLLVIDYSRDGSDEAALRPAELARLQRKPDGSRRIVLAYLSIGEAETYRYYWQSAWGDLWRIPNVWSSPHWRASRNDEWRDNYAVRYWDPDWQSILLGKGGYLDRILKAGFDGVWLDKVDSSSESVAKGRPTARSDMIALVRRIAEHGRRQRRGFLVVPQNGEELLEDAAYRGIIDGFGKEDLLFGETVSGKPNPEEQIAARSALIESIRSEGKPVLAVEYLIDRAMIDRARQRLASLGYIPHFADRELADLRIGDYPGSTAGKRGRRSPESPNSLPLIVAVALALLALLFLVRRRTGAR